MIRKDIVYQDTGQDIYQGVEEEKEPQKSVDEIFADADAEMNKMQYSHKDAQKPRKKMGTIKKTLLTMLILSVVSVIGFIVFTVKTVSDALPNVKETILEEFETMREELITKDDSDLSVDEYYQKQIMLLIPPEAIEEKINHLSSLEVLLGVVQGDGTLNLDIIPDDKKDEYEKLMEEYAAAKEAEAEQVENQKSNKASEETNTEN